MRGWLPPVSRASTTSNCDIQNCLCHYRQQKYKSQYAFSLPTRKIQATTHIHSPSSLRKHLKVEQKIWWLNILILSTCHHLCSYYSIILLFGYIWWCHIFLRQTTKVSKYPLLFVILDRFWMASKCYSVANPSSSPSLYSGVKIQ